MRVGRLREGGREQLLDYLGMAGFVLLGAGLFALNWKWALVSLGALLLLMSIAGALRQ